MLIIGLIIGGLVIDLGGAPNRDRLGFRYWRNPGAFNSYILDGSAGNFLAFWKVMIPAAFSYGNIQIVAISGSETRDPRRLIPSATKKVFWRILFFYICSLFIVGLIVCVTYLSLLDLLGADSIFSPAPSMTLRCRFRLALPHSHPSPSPSIAPGCQWYHLLSTLSFVPPPSPLRQLASSLPQGRYMV